MRLWFRLWLGPLVLLWLLAGCARSEQLFHEQIYVFGTLVDITLWGVESARAQKAADAVAADFQKMHRDWHPWEPGELTELNRALAAGKPFQVDPWLLELIQQSKVLSRESDGLFNPAIGKLIGLWGFHSEDIRRVRPPPSKQAIAALVAQHPSMDDIDITGSTVRSRNPAVELDLGAIAKGYAGDLALKRLKELGIANAMINLGGGISAMGRHGDRAWRVGVRHPQGEGILASIELHGEESVHTSGNYERYNEYEGVRYAHIIDPRTGMPVQGITSATVIHDNGAVTDAAATAMVVAGTKDWHRIAKQMGVKCVMLVDESGTIYMSPEMAGRVHFDEDQGQNGQRRIVVSDPL